MNPPMTPTNESKKSKTCKNKSKTCKNRSSHSTDSSKDNRTNEKRKCSKHCKSGNCKYCAILSEAPQYLGVQFLVGNDITTKQLTSSQIHTKEITTQTLTFDRLIHNNKTETHNIREWLDTQNGNPISDTSKTTFTLPIYQNILELIAKPLVSNSSDDPINVTTLLFINVLSTDGTAIKSKVLDRYQDIIPPHQDITIRILYKGPFPEGYLTLDPDKTIHLTLTIDRGEFINTGFDDVYISFQN